MEIGDRPTDNKPDSSLSVLITGATGFVGSAIVIQCQAAGLTIRTTGRRALPAIDLPDYRRADLLDATCIAPLLEGVDSVVHSAGLAHQFKKRNGEVSRFTEVNAEGTKNIVQAAVAAGVRHFVLISSVSVYGPHTIAECDEGSPCNPEGIYAQSKYLAEQQSIEIAERAGMPLTILRLATVYGEGDPGNVARLMRAIDRGHFVWLGSGSNSKSLIHSEDVARACVAVLRTPSIATGIFNVSGSPCTIREVVEGLASALGRRLPKWRIPASLILGLTSRSTKLNLDNFIVRTLHGNLQKWLADDVYNGMKFQETFAFKTVVALPEGLGREVAWYRQQNR